MAVAVTSGGTDTEAPVADEKRVDMANDFKLLDPEESQFYTMTSNLPGRPATREKFNWLR